MLIDIVSPIRNGMSNKLKIDGTQHPNNELSFVNIELTILTPLIPIAAIEYIGICRR